MPLKIIAFFGRISTPRRDTGGKHENDDDATAGGCAARRGVPDGSSLDLPRKKARSQGIARGEPARRLRHALCCQSARKEEPLAPRKRASPTFGLNSSSKQETSLCNTPRFCSSLALRHSSVLSVSLLAILVSSGDLSSLHATRHATTLVTAFTHDPPLV